MSYNHDLLMATLHANHMQKGDFTGKGYREELQERAAKAPGSGGSGGADLSALLETTYTDTLTWDDSKPIITHRHDSSDPTEFFVYKAQRVCDSFDTAAVNGLNGTLTFNSAMFDEGNRTVTGEMFGGAEDGLGYFMVSGYTGIAAIITDRDNVTFSDDIEGAPFYGTLPTAGTYLIQLDTGSTATGETVSYMSVESLKVSAPIFPTQTIKSELLPSWNDLPDKPFGEVNDWWVAMPATEVTGELSEGAYGLNLNCPALSSVPAKARITFDGTEYECSVIEPGDGSFAYGNAALMDGGADTGEPFLLLLAPAAGTAALALIDGAAHTVAFSLCGGKIKQIDPKYLPVIKAYIAPSELHSTRGYLYKDAMGLTKYTLAELEPLLQEGAWLVVSFGGFINYYPSAVAWDDGYVFATVWSGEQWMGLHSAEYTIT